MYLRSICNAVIPLLLLVGLLRNGSDELPGLPQTDSSRQVVTRDGIRIELSVKPVAPGEKQPDAGSSGQDVELSFSITDSASGTPISGLRPLAWIDPVRESGASDGNACRQKVQTYLRGSLRARPEIDLNSFFILTLNNEPNISVIDPLLGFGGSKLLALIMLNSPGEDWALTDDAQRLFVTQPKSNQVAVIDTNTWKVVKHLDAGSRPVRIALQPDEKYLWVGNEAKGAGADGGVTVIDTASLKVAARIKTGSGGHEILITPDDRYAFVSNQDDGTVSIIDVRKLSLLKRIEVGKDPVSMAFSALSNSVYVVCQKGGKVYVISPEKLGISATIDLNPGGRTIRFSDDGRWGFVANIRENLVTIFDASTNRIHHSLEVPNKPDQITFTSSLAYIRSAGSDQISLVQLATLGKDTPVQVWGIPGGQMTPDQGSFPASADSIVPGVEPNSALVANAADGVIYYFTEGMTAPMGNFQNYRREPRAVLIADRSLREKRTGFYRTTSKFSHGGNFEMAFMLDSPRIFHCFRLSLESSLPGLSQSNGVPLKIEPAQKGQIITTGREYRLEFKAIDPRTKQPKVELRDLRVFAFLYPGTWQKRMSANNKGNGNYEVNFTPPKSGFYYVFFECPSLNVTYRQIPYLTLRSK